MLKTLFLLLKAAKLGPALKTLVTMVLSVGTYALFWGWRYAAGFVALIFCHEMGHFLAARQRGLPVGTPTFIPFVGAWIQLDRVPRDVETEAYVGLAGPVVGSGAALACYFVGQSLGSDLLIALSLWRPSPMLILVAFIAAPQVILSFETHELLRPIRSA